MGCGHGVGAGCGSRAWGGVWRGGCFALINFGVRPAWLLLMDHVLRTTAPMPAPILANAENRYLVTAADLPLACPMPGMTLWNSHPRVYLPIAVEHECKCPYCGAVYVLQAA